MLSYIALCGGQGADIVSEILSRFRIKIGEHGVKILKKKKEFI